MPDLILVTQRRAERASRRMNGTSGATWFETSLKAPPHHEGLTFVHQLETPSRLDSARYLGGGAFDRFDRRGTASRVFHRCIDPDTGRLKLDHQGMGGRRLRRRQVRRLWPGL